VPTDTARSRSDAAKFALSGVAASLGFFGLLRLTWTEAHVVLPFTRAQGWVAGWLFGPSALPVQITLACSGADALALCLGAILAYPIAWRARLAGAGAGVALIVGLNILRIGTLGRAAASPAWFNALHIYIWPAVLTLAIAGYVFAWMRLAERRRMVILGGGAPSAPAAARPAPQPSRRFVLLTAVFLLLFLAASPLYLQSASVLALAGFIARAAAATLGMVGVSAHAAANVLSTPRGSFLVTQECISTPLIPIYLAAVCTYSATWRRLTLGVVATLPIFIGLGIARLLVVALPATVVASPLFLVHAFYQLLLGAVAVFLAALWRHRRKAALGYALAGVVAGMLFVGLLGPSYSNFILSPAGALLDDPQEAIALLPAFQVGLYLALGVATFVAVGWGHFLVGLSVLALTQTAGVLALQALTTHSSLTVDVRDVRGWAIAAPVLIFAVMVTIARPSR
jgi:exosortase/archaeosortase family protein